MWRFVTGLDNKMGFLSHVTMKISYMKADLTLEYALTHMLSYVIAASLFSEPFHNKF